MTLGFNQNVLGGLKCWMLHELLKCHNFIGITNIAGLYFMSFLFFMGMDVR